jgi:hypothetical protein
VSTVIHAPPTPESFIYEEWKRQQNQPAINSNLKNHENVIITIIFKIINIKRNTFIIFFC